MLLLHVQSVNNFVMLFGDGVHARLREAKKTFSWYGESQLIHPKL